MDTPRPYYVIVRYPEGEFMISLPIAAREEADHEADEIIKASRHDYEWWHDPDDDSPIPPEDISLPNIGQIQVGGIEEVLVLRQVGPTRTIGVEN